LNIGSCQPRKRDKANFKKVLYPQYFIDDLKNRADIVRIIQPYAELKKKGANWMACCPFHQEKTPSFSVNPSKGFYKCFGCGKGGTAFNFLMDMEGLSFPEAIKRVAEITGVMLPEPIDDQQYERSKKKKEEKKKLADQVIDLNRVAMEFWEAELQGKGKKAKEARAYLAERGISPETQKTFRIGFSPDTWDSLLNVLKESGADEKLMEQSGLVIRHEERDSLYDRFRGRIMFPVLDVDGNPVAFGARAMGDEQPKYLNSPETPAYIKGQHLYGLFHSKNEIRKRKFVLLVEGYLDLIVLHQHGVRNVVASLGTALTPEQARLLKRFSENIVSTYDGDEAGARASKKILNTLLFNDFEIKVLQIPNGMDPDEFIRKEGVEKFNALRGKAPSVLDFLLARMPVEYNLSNNQQRIRFIEEVIPICASFRSTVKGNAAHREFFDNLMSAMRVNDPTVRQEWWRLMKKEVAKDPRGNERVERTGEPKPLAVTLPKARITVAEQLLLELLVYDRELSSLIFPRLEPSDYESLATASVFSALMQIHQHGEEPSLERLTELVGEEDETTQDFIPLLLMTEPKRAEGEDIETVLHEAENCVVSLRLMAINSRISELMREQIQAEQAGDLNLANELARESIELAKIKREFQQKLANL
jgi:DNA primase